MDLEAALVSHRDAMASVATMGGELEAAIARLKETFSRDGRLFICGNGGSAADAQHFAAELTGRYKADRPGFPAYALTTDSSALTAIGNDYGFERIYARQLESLARPGDCLMAISTSGHSPNVQAAVEAAKEGGVTTIGLLGRDGGSLAGLVDQALVVPANETARIQEAHIFILHFLCEAFETGAVD